MKTLITTPGIFLVVIALPLILGACSSIPQPPQVWPENGKMYPVKLIDGKRYLTIPPEDYLLQTNVPVPVAPSTEGVSIRVSLGDQRAWLYQNGELAIAAVCCPGKAGHETPTGTFHVVSKHKDWVSTIYHVPMPYLLRLSTPQQDIGIHQGIIAIGAASHGCIRLPKEKAIEFFEATPVGTTVTIMN